jgi:uncharacterized protein YaiE (UPF0345 family)
MELLAGTLEVQLPDGTEKMIFNEGAIFDIPAHTKFKITALALDDYCCSYIH